MNKPADQPEQKPAKADVQTLAYLLKEIDNSLHQCRWLGRIGGGLLFFGGVGILLVGGGIYSSSNDGAIAAAGLVIIAIGFSRMFQ